MQPSGLQIRKSKILQEMRRLSFLRRNLVAEFTRNTETCKGLLSEKNDADASGDGESNPIDSISQRASSQRDSYPG